VYLEVPPTIEGGERKMFRGKTRSLWPRHAKTWKEERRTVFCQYRAEREPEKRRRPEVVGIEEGNTSHPPFYGKPRVTKGGVTFARAT